jgi:hypothetical protein
MNIDEDENLVSRDENFILDVIGNVFTLTACFFNILYKKMPGGETASFAPTLTFSDYSAFETIWGLLIFVKVGARFPRPQSMIIEW